MRSVSEGHRVKVVTMLQKQYRKSFGGRGGGSRRPENNKGRNPTREKALDREKEGGHGASIS